MTQSAIDLLKELSEAPGIPGFEGEIRKIVRSRLKGVGKEHVDRLGSVIFEKRGTADRPRVLLPGHMDEIGFMVKYIEDKGFLRFMPVGGWLPHVVGGLKVKVHTNHGPLPGVVGFKPPHITPPDKREKVTEIKDLYIDIGASSRSEAEKMGVRMGDPVTADIAFCRMGVGGKYLAGKAWDDRMSVALFIEVLRRLKGVRHPNTVFGAGTVQEEVGLRGASTAAHVADPDVCLVLDTGVPADTPDVDKKEAHGELGKGPIITLIDSGMIPSRKLRDLAIDVAKKNRIPWQYGYLYGGATDGAAVQRYRTGVYSLWLGPPVRYVHSPVGVMHADDFENCIRLVVEIVKRLDARTVASFAE